MITKAFFTFPCRSRLFSGYTTSTTGATSSSSCKYESTVESGGCFSGAETLTLESGASKTMDSVVVGDRVLTADGNGKLSFSEVIFLPHAANSDPATFVELTTGSGKSLKATKMHLLQTCSGSLAFASSFAVGSCIRTVDGDESIVLASLTTSKGLYTAVTMNEFLVVNGVVASPFAVAHGITHAFYNIHRALYVVAPNLLKVPGVSTTNSLIGATAAFAYTTLVSS
jgi:hypothetical protein